MEEPLNLGIDTTRIIQVMHNLLLNAVRYTPSGGKVHLRAHSAPGFVVIEVQDTGIGLSLEQSKNIFRPFHRASGEKYCGEGVGIGLTVVERIVLAHRGSVEVHSEGLGRGTCFRVRLPV